MDSVENYVIITKSVKRRLLIKLLITFFIIHIKKYKLYNYKNPQFLISFKHILMDNFSFASYGIVRKKYIKFMFGKHFFYIFLFFLHISVILLKVLFFSHYPQLI